MKKGETKKESIVFFFFIFINNFLRTGLSWRIDAANLVKIKSFEYLSDYLTLLEEDLI